MKEKVTSVSSHIQHPLQAVEVKIRVFATINSSHIIITSHLLNILVRSNRALGQVIERDTERDQSDRGAGRRLGHGRGPWGEGRERGR